MRNIFPWPEIKSVLTCSTKKHLANFYHLAKPQVPLKKKKKITLPFIQDGFLGFLSLAVPAESKNQGEDEVPEEADLQILPCLLSSEVRLLSPPRPLPSVPWQRELPLSVTVT